jgi:sporulation protein YlmC with PRC-barrel domain
MKKALAVMSIVVAMASMAVAQTPPATTSTAKPAMQMATDYFRGSKILGADIENAAGETVGEVQDLVMLRDQQGLQAILSVGGFLGIGERYVAIPYDKLQVSRKDDDIQVMYNTTKADLEGLPKFPYKESEGGNITFRASDLIGANVKNATDETVGEVDDLIIPTAQTMPQVILSVGEYAGDGDKLVAIPYDALDIRHDNGKQQVMYNATADELKTMPAFTYN